MKRDSQDLHRERTKYSNIKHVVETACVPKLDLIENQFYLIRILKILFYIP